MHDAYGIRDACAEADALLEAYEGECLADDRAFSARILALHASSKERLPCIDAFYAFVCGEMRGKTGRAASVLDIGCGFHPFALPWMEAGRDVRYHAFDIGSGNVETLNRYFARAGFANARALLRNALEELPGTACDVAFVLKLLPLLEQQRKGSAKDLLERISAARIVVSFPTRSLSGREKGMESFYSDFMEKNLPAGRHIAARDVIGNELVYVIIHHANQE